MSAQIVNDQDKWRLSLAQLEAIKSIMNRRVMGAVANLSDRITKLAAVVTVYRRLGADLLAKFAVPDVVDIPAEQFIAVCEFLETAVIAPVGPSRHASFGPISVPEPQVELA